MQLIDPNLSMKDNYIKATDIAFAAWQLAGHDHREEYRNSGQSAARTAWLNSERIEILKDALADGELVALGISPDDPAMEIVQIPENLFFAADLRIDGENSSIAGLSRTFANVRICRVIEKSQRLPANLKSTGRPNHLLLIVDVWATLKAEMPSFVELDKSTQNREIAEMAARLFPAKFPGNCRIGDSTIRRHRRNHAALFD
jgi:hypothetical protein